MTKEEMVKAIRAHARENYNNGWDVLVECYSDQEILSDIGDKTLEKAILDYDKIFQVIKERNEEFMMEANSHYVAAGLPPFWDV